VSAYPDHILRVGSQHLAELKRKAAEFERQLWDAHESLEQELEQAASATEVMVDAHPEAFRWTGEAADGHVRGGHTPADRLPAPPDADVDETDRDTQIRAPGDPTPTLSDAGVDAESRAYMPSAAGVDAVSPAYAPSDTAVGGASPAWAPDERTARLIHHGRKRPKPSHRGRNIVLTGLAIAIGAALITILIRAAFRPGPSWPASVATVQRQIATACQNPDVRSEPSQVNFACNKATRQILWVFSLMTSGNNPDFASIRTGRQGLEPIRPSQGGQVAWSLNLHHPYSPANPIDSLQVAARAINNIIGGATLTAANGKPVVQPGLESRPANCARYTGSAAVTSHNGYPALCAKPITSKVGQGYLVADVFEKWMVGAPRSAAQNAAILFQNAHNPGDPRVRAILRSLSSSTLSG
jgi:hypothetical protein